MERPLRSSIDLLDSLGLEQETSGRFARFYAALRQTNQAIAQATSESELLDAVCRIVCEHTGLISAWVAVADPSTGAVTCKAASGIARERLDRAAVSVDAAEPGGRGPTGTALRTGLAHVVQDVTTDDRTRAWTEHARTHNVRSAAAFPLRRGGAIAGALSLYASEAGLFDRGLVALLEGLAEDVSHALDNLDVEAERRRMEQAIRQNESSYRHLFELNPQAMWVYEIASMRFLAVNDAAIARYGYSRDEFLQMTIADVRPQEELARFLQSYPSLSGAGRKSSGEWRHRRKDGTLIDVEVSSHPIDFGGRAARLVLAQDLTRQRCAEIDLRRSEEKYRALFDSARDGIFVGGRDGRFLDSNQRGAELFGVPRDHLIGLTPLAFSPARQPDGRRSSDLVQSYIERALAGESQEFEWRHRRYDGVEFDSIVGLNRVELGGQPCYQAIVHDITERRQAEERSRREGLRYKTLMQAATDGIHILDSDGQLLEANDRFFQMLGYDPARPPRLHVSDWDAKHTFNELMPIVQRTLHGGDTVETLHRRADGTTFPVEVSLIGVDLGDRRVLYCAARDTSGRRAAEQERASLQQALLQSQKMESVGRLAGGVAHDFNNLLTVIAGYASLLTANEQQPPAVREKAAHILKATEHASELTRKLLIFSRRHPDEPKVISLDEFVSQEAAVVPRLIGEHIAVSTTLGAVDLHVKIDPARLSQVLINLIVNARDAMPEGGALTLATGFEHIAGSRATRRPGVKPGKYVRLSVTDTGFGMDADVQAHLFEPFFTTKEVGRGTGLGLATVYGIVQQAGGFIDVRSAPGQGTTMAVLLPVARGAASAPTLSPAPDVRGGNETVLVVEDEPGVRELTRLILSRLGYTVLEAATPGQALKIARAGGGFDLVVTDVVMPEMNGRKLVSEIQHLASDFEVLYVSGFADTGVAGTTDIHEDPQHFLAKPFTPAGLAKKVRELLDQRRPA